MVHSCALPIDFLVNGLEFFFEPIVLDPLPDKMPFKVEHDACRQQSPSR